MIRAALRSRWSLVVLVLAIFSGVHLAWAGRFELTPTISLVEGEWSLWALIGATYSMGFLWRCGSRWEEAWRRVLEDRLGERPSAVAEAELAATEVVAIFAFVLFGVHMILLSFGAVAMLRAQAPLPVDPLGRFLGVWFGVALTVIGELLVLALFVARTKQDRLRALVRQMVTKPPQ